MFPVADDFGLFCLELNPSQTCGVLSSVPFMHVVSICMANDTYTDCVQATS